MFGKSPGRLGATGSRTPIQRALPYRTLNLDFTNGSVFDPRITFTRATSATYVSSAGVLELVSSNSPRFDYDPVTLAPKGLLIEEQRTNLLLNSDTLPTQSVTTTAVATTLSFYGTGSVTLSGTATGTLVGIGAYPSRVRLTFTATAGTLTLTVTGSVRFANLEAGAFPTSYIPTTTAQVTRAADVAVMTGANFSQWFSQAAFTAFAQFSTLWSAPLTTTQSPYVLGFDDTNVVPFNGYGMLLSPISATSSIRCSGRQGATAPNAATNAGFIAANAVYKAAIAVDAIQLTVAASGITPVSVGNSVVGSMTTLNRLQIGAGNQGGGTPYSLNGHIRRIAFYRTRLSNAQLQALSA